MPTPEEEARWRETDRIVPIPDHKPTPHLWPKLEEQFVCPLSGTTRVHGQPQAAEEVHGMLTITAHAPVSDSRIPTDTMLDSLPTLASASDCPRCVWRDYGVHGLDHFAEEHPDRIDETGRELLRPLLIAAWRRHGYHVTLLCHHDCAADLASADGPSDEMYVAVRQEAADRLPYGADFAEAADLSDEYQRGE